jgi:hypothetical protein
LVRKIRKLKKGVNKGKVKKPIMVNNREGIIQRSINEKKDILEFESPSIEETNKLEKTPIQKEDEI